MEKWINGATCATTCFIRNATAKGLISNDLSVQYSIFRSHRIIQQKDRLEIDIDNLPSSARSDVLGALEERDPFETPRKSTRRDQHGVIEFDTAALKKSFNENFPKSTELDPVFLLSIPDAERKVLLFEYSRARDTTKSEASMFAADADLFFREFSAKAEENVQLQATSVPLSQSQIILPPESQLSSTVYNELPPSLRSDIDRAYKKRKLEHAVAEASTIEAVAGMSAARM